MNIKVIQVGEKILGKNEDKASENKKRLDKNGTLTINIMSSPGAGKTSLILSTIKELSKKYKIAVIEGDVASSVDSEKVNALGTPVVQINTNGGCHLDAFMVANGLDNLPSEKVDLLFIENVGNLICPNAYLLGEDVRLIIASTPEGDDKPYKYPAMFADSDIVILNKTDLQPHLDFNEKAFRKVVTKLNPDVIILPVSCKTKAGLKDWFDWLEKTIIAKKKK